MKNKKKNIEGLRPEYDFDYSKAVRGKYYRKLLDPDISKAFRDSSAVNEALRSLLIPAGEIEDISNKRYKEAGAFFKKFKRAKKTSG